MEANVAHLSPVCVQEGDEPVSKVESPRDTQHLAYLNRSAFLPDPVAPKPPSFMWIHTAVGFTRTGDTCTTTRPQSIPHCKSFLVRSHRTYIPRNTRKPNISLTKTAVLFMPDPRCLVLWVLVSTWLKWAFLARH